MSSRYRIKNPPVVAETLEGEATIVDLDSGTYYALNESGSLIWDRLTSGWVLEGISAELRERYELSEDTADSDLQALVTELLERNLIAPLGNGEGAPVTASNGATPDPNGAAPYAAPRLSVYTDMQELLLLDPVHEVDDSGWPSQP
jgi:outer membrane protein assembly factor BamB